MLKGSMELRLGSEQRVCGQGDVVVIPGGTEHKAWFREDTEVIDFFAPPREDFLLGGDANRFRPPRADDHSVTSNRSSEAPVHWRKVGDAGQTAPFLALRC